MTSLAEFMARRHDRHAPPAILESRFSKSNSQFQPGLKSWLKLLGEVQSARFFVTQIELEQDGQPPRARPL